VLCVTDSRGYVIWRRGAVMAWAALNGGE